MAHILRSRRFLRYLPAFAICAVLPTISVYGQIPGATISWVNVTNDGGHPHPLLATGPDGNAWFLDDTRGVVGKLTVTGSPTSTETDVTETIYPIAAALPAGQTSLESSLAIAGGPDAVWFIARGKTNAFGATPTADLGRVTPDGTITMVAINGSTNNADGMVVGPDGNVWFSDGTNQYVIRTTPQGTATMFKTTQHPGRWLVVGPDQNIWFSEGAVFGRITSSGALTEFPVTGSGALVSGPDGNLWYAADINKIGRLTTSGQETLYTISGANGIGGITTGPDGNLWFTSDGKDIGQFVISSGTGNIQTCTGCPSSGAAGDIVPVYIPASAASVVRTMGTTPAANNLIGAFGAYGNLARVSTGSSPACNPPVTVQSRSLDLRQYDYESSLNFDLPVQNAVGATSVSISSSNLPSPEVAMIGSTEVEITAHLPPSFELGHYTLTVVVTDSRPCSGTGTLDVYVLPKLGVKTPIDSFGLLLLDGLER